MNEVDTKESALKQASACLQICLNMDIQPLKEEDVLLKRLQAGDNNSFATIYNHYRVFVFERVLQLLHSPDLSEDITQEIFLKIWEHREKLSEVRSFKSYLFITARNSTLNVLKKTARSAAGMGEIVRHYDEVRNITEDHVQDNEYRKFISQKLDELPLRSREIFKLCREQSKTYNEVAAELGISRDAVKSRMMYAMKTLGDSAKKETGLPLKLLLAMIGPV